MGSYNPVTAVLRGLEVLRVVNAEGLASVKAIHAATGFDKATIVRMLETLIHAGYVVHDATGGGYRVSGRVMQLSAGFKLHDTAAELAGPILGRFRQKIGWPSDFAICDRDAMILVRTTREPGPLYHNRTRGYRAPILYTSLGKSYLAFCPDAERSEILKMLRAADTTNSVPSDDAIENALVQIRAQGFAVMEDSYSAKEYNNTFWAIAVPVMTERRVYGAVNIMMLRQAVTQRTAEDAYLPGLREAAAEIARTFEAASL